MHPCNTQVILGLLEDIYRYTSSCSSRNTNIYTLLLKKVTSFDALFHVKMRIVSRQDDISRAEYHTRREALRYNASDQVSV